VHVVYSEQHRLHAPVHDIEEGSAVPNPDHPDRAERIVEVLRADPSFNIVAPTEHGRGSIEAVHAPALVRYLAEAWSSSRGVELFPDTMPHARLHEGFDGLSREPEFRVGRIGYWCFDTGTPIMEHTYVAAREAVDVALTAADLVLAGERITYGLCRPPGHHAARSVFGGFCYFNNAAIAAEYVVACTGGRVAVVDIDYHHGNGTQQIFYRRPDVLYVSLHADPSRAFPYFTGYTEETGAGPGLGFTVNYPLAAAIGDSAYLSVLEGAMEDITRFAPEVTVVSLGLDSYRKDPLGDFALTNAVYAECGRLIREASDRVVVLQEGGYYLPELGDNVRQFLLGAS
jgi:acetoin utilization deacetylase AcuC-like enzyme